MLFLTNSDTRRMHSSRMHTDRVLTVFLVCLLRGVVCLLKGAIPSGRCLNGDSPSKVDHLNRQNLLIPKAHPNPPKANPLVDRQTPVKTLPSLDASYAVGNEHSAQNKQFRTNQKYFLSAKKEVF